MIENTAMCIYQIIHWHTGKSYVGQTVHPVKRRWKHHCSPSPSKPPTKFSNAIKKYGKDAFEFAILEECETLEQLNEREKFWIAELNTLSPNGYNLDSGGKNKIPSEETRIKASIAHKGQIPSVEARKKMSDSHKLRINSPDYVKPVLTPAQLKRASECQLGKTSSLESRIKLSVTLLAKRPIDLTAKEIAHREKSRLQAAILRSNKKLGIPRVYKQSVEIRELQAIDRANKKLGIFKKRKPAITHEERLKRSMLRKRAKRDQIKLERELLVNR